MTKPNSDGLWTVFASNDMLGHYVIEEAQTEQEIALDKDSKKAWKEASKNDQDNIRLIAYSPKLLQAAKNALADLEGIMPEFEPSGNRLDPAWQTIRELRQLIEKAEDK